MSEPSTEAKLASIKERENESADISLPTGFFVQQAIDAATAKKLDKLRAILKERSKGEVDTWGFVAAFMDMIDEAEKS